MLQRENKSDGARSWDGKENAETKSATYCMMEALASHAGELGNKMEKNVTREPACYPATKVRATIPALAVFALIAAGWGPNGGGVSIRAACGIRPA
jgi:hypothetical protein